MKHCAEVVINCSYYIKLWFLNLSHEPTHVQNMDEVYTGIKLVSHLLQHFQEPNSRKYVRYIIRKV
jgi:hypothetical protein